MLEAPSGADEGLPALPCVANARERSVEVLGEAGREVLGLEQKELVEMLGAARLIAQVNSRLKNSAQANSVCAGRPEKA